MADVAKYDPVTGNIVDQNVGYLPPTGDSGINYGQDVWNLLKGGTGVLLQKAASNPVFEFEGKDRYEVRGGQLTRQGDYATTQALARSWLPYLVAGAAVVGFLLLYSGGRPKS